MIVQRHDLRLDVDRDLLEPLPALDHGLPGPWVWIGAGVAFLAAFAVGWGPRRRAAPNRRPLGSALPGGPW